VANYFQSWARSLYDRANPMAVQAIHFLRAFQFESWGQGRGRQTITAAAIGEDEDEEKGVAT